MISMLCQKSNSGIIVSEDRDLFNYIVLGDHSNNNSRVSKTAQPANRKKVDTAENEENDNGNIGSPSYSSIELENFNVRLGELDSSFLKKFPIKPKKSTKNEAVFNKSNMESNSTTFTMYKDHLPQSEKFTYTTSTVPTTNNPTTTTSTTNRAKSETVTIKSTPSSKTTTALEIARPSIDDQKRYPFKRISAKKMKNVQHWLNQKLTDKPSSSLNDYNKLNDVLEKEKELSDDIERSIRNADISKLRKKEIIYKNWHLNVYEPIQKEIHKNMNGPNAEYARGVRNIRYLEYLHQVNKHGCVYQDDYEPEEYNPIDLVGLDASVHRKLKDPTNLPQRKTFIEDKTIYKCITGKNFSLRQTEKTKLPIIIHDNETRADLDWNSWLLNQYNTIESTARNKSSLKCKPDRHNSEFNLDWMRDTTLDTFVSSNSVYVDHTKTMKK